jgi:hypothetical protein
MSRPMALFLLGCAMTGCSLPQPYLLYGNANAATVGYASDPAATLPIAKAFCAGYGRVPRLLQAQQNYAYYECHKP